ncbi:9908_t:CDS:1, partial [Gigaspora rosea]
EIEKRFGKTDRSGATMRDRHWIRSLKPIRLQISGIQSVLEKEF